MRFDDRTWIQPDVTVLHTLPATDEEDRWVPASYCSMVVEFTSPGNRRKDAVDTAELCARGKIPYLMRVELVRRLGHASVQLSRLSGNEYELVAQATAGRTFDVDEPFPMRFDPRQLLP